MWSDGLEGKVGVPRGWESRAALCLGEELTFVLKGRGYTLGLSCRQTTLDLGSGQLLKSCISHCLCSQGIKSSDEEDMIQPVSHRPQDPTT